MADFGEILRSIGEFGLFQQLTLIAVCVPNFIQPFVLASSVFIESDPERHCNTDWILQADSNLTTEEQLNLTLPREEDGTFSRCRMFVPVDWDIGAIREYGLNETTGCQDGWVYHNTIYEATIVTDFDLVCDRANLLQVTQTVFMAGILAGSIVFGPFAESFGRKRAAQISAVMTFIFTVTAALCPNVYLHLASLFLLATGRGGYRVNSMILSTEWIGPSKRSLGTCVSMLSGAVGQCVLAGVIYAIRHWRLAQLVLIAPLTVMVFYMWFIPESARWLLSRGRTEEAKREIIKAASINKRPVPDSLLQKLKGMAGVIYAIRHWRLAQLITAAPLAVVVVYIWFIPESARWLSSRGRTEEAKREIVKAASINKRPVPDSLLDNIAVTNTGNKGGIQVIFISRVLTMYLFLIMLAWFSVNLSAFSLHFNMGNLGLNIFLTQFLFGAIEIPAYLMCIFGRKILLVSTLLTGGLCCILILAFPQGCAIAATSLAVAAHFFQVWAGSVCYVFVQELFPTSVRQTATALVAMSGGVGGLLAPLLNILATYHWVIPIAVFSSLTLVSGALSFLLPETRRKELPESADEVENSNRCGTSKDSASWSNVNSTRL